MQEDSQQISGCVEEITFRNSQSGFTVIKLIHLDEQITAVGLMPAVQVGENVRLTGEWQIHKTFGHQFRVESCVSSMPADLGSMFRYLASGAIKGIGVSTAEKIVEKFGADVFNVLENDPEALSQIKGISHNGAQKICESFKQQQRTRETIEELQNMGLTPAESMRAFNVYGNRITEKFEENPYILCDEDIGIPFDRADEIVLKLSARPHEFVRIMAGIKYILTHNLGNGHTCVPRELIIKPAENLLGCDSDSAEIAVDNLISSGEVIERVLDGRPFLFLPDIYEAEFEIAQFMKRQVEYPPVPVSSLESRIEIIEARLGIQYEQIQKKAIKIALEKGMLILTGGPGTGKTTTLNGIIRLLQNSGLDIALTAPTGRAAKRITEITGFDASTIHRLLEVEWDKRDNPVFTRNERNPLDYDAVIIDEVSMVDVKLFAALLKALPLGCRIIMVGDFDQLPPVGAGNILQDLISWGKIEVVKLTEIFRQSMTSAIIKNAHSIVRGEIPDLNSTDGDFFFINNENTSSAAAETADLVCRRLKKAYNYSPVDDIQVLCASRIGETGTVNMNRIIQQKLNPKQKGKKELVHNGYVLREGDKVMQIKNNYDIFWTNLDDMSEGTGVYNGDIGKLVNIDMANAQVQILFDERLATYTFEQCADVELAYAVTVHKSQGSEFCAVVMPAVGVPARLCYRNLLYTAVTRAKKLLVIVGTRSEIERMIKNDKKAKRFSALRYFLEL